MLAWNDYLPGFIVQNNHSICSREGVKIGQTFSREWKSDCIDEASLSVKGHVGGS